MRRRGRFAHGADRRAEPRQVGLHGRRRPQRVAAFSGRRAAAGALDAADLEPILVVRLVLPRARAAAGDDDPTAARDGARRGARSAVAVWARLRRRRGGGGERRPVRQRPRRRRRRRQHAELERAAAPTTPPPPPLRPRRAVRERVGGRVPARRAGARPLTRLSPAAKRVRRNLRDKGKLSILSERRSGHTRPLDGLTGSTSPPKFSVLAPGRPLARPGRVARRHAQVQSSRVDLVRLRKILAEICYP